MKKLFQIIGFISLMGFSFFYTEKTVNVVKEYDDIMITLKEKQKEYKKDYIDASINKNTIIPGLSGENINLNKSYSKMKRYGQFEESLIVIKKIKPKISIENNKDKYIISGNKNKRQVSLIFLVDKNDNIDEIIKILDKKKVKGNFFVDGYWLEKNSNLISILVNERHVIGNLSYNMDYTNNSFIWMETIIEKIAKQKQGYCYNEIDDINTLKVCELNNNYTIRPNIIVKNSPYTEIKEKLTSGSIISLKINDRLVEELPIIINYIKRKGFTIETLDKHLEE
jgi:hypothetical protein